jgi:translation initiation factor IF-3
MSRFLRKERNGEVVRNISKENLINEEIRDKELRVIDSDGTQLGIMSLEAAQALAAEKKLDLVNIAPKAQPPVCRILDYGKYRYEMQKREKEAKKKQKTVQIKEIRLSTFIEDHDLSVKANNATKFLKEGDKVKVSLRFKGREKDYASKGLAVMKRFAEHTEEVSAVERKAEFEGRSLIMILAPKGDK